MRHALGSKARELADVARSRVVLGFDFDGTLAPIVADRNRAKMRRRTRALVAKLCRLYPCAVISGRAREDVAKRLDGVPFKHVVGSHGVHHGELDTYERTIAAARIHLAPLERERGIQIEDKRYSIAVHYRHAPNRSAALRWIAAATTSLSPAVRILHGKCVVDVLPASAPNKGDALAALRATEAAQQAIFVGDDRTDEDAFAHADPVFGIRVGFSRRSKARYFVRDQREVDRLLAWLVMLRER